MGGLRRHRVWLVALGILVAVGVSAWWALPQLWSPPQAPGIAALSSDSPLANLMTTPDPSTDSETSSAEQPTDGGRQTAGLGLVQERGRLALEIDGQPMGEEVYQLSRRPDGGIELVSKGQFSLKVWFATVSFNYTQDVQMDTRFHPEQYRLDLDGPLGVGNRHIRADVADREARIQTGKEPQTVSLPDGPVTFIGVLASYALTPKLMDDVDRQSLNAIIFDVRDRHPSLAASVPTVSLEIRRQGSAQLASEQRDQSIDVARYRLDLLNKPDYQLVMYTQDRTFMALKGQFREDEPPFRIYRVDRLPGGFTAHAQQ